MRIDPHQTLEKVRELYEIGTPKVFSTGFPSLDPYYKIALKQWTLVTGYPGSGKSEFLDAIMVNLAENDNWRFAIFSPENQPTEIHWAKILEKHIRKPFSRGPTERMTLEEIDEAGESFVASRFAFIPTEHCTLGHVLDQAVQWIGNALVTLPHGIVIDPWNHIEQEIPVGMSETNYISACLNQIIHLCREWNIHIWLVAHPSKTMLGKGGELLVPRPRDVSGSAHWWNKSDNCITIFRDQSDERSRITEIHVQKVRFKYCGMSGLVNLTYDRVTGRYNDLGSLMTDVKKRAALDV